MFKGGSDQASLFFLMRPKLQKRSALKLASRIIPEA